MEVTRKELLASGAVLALAGCGGGGQQAAAPKGWAAVRAQFGLDPRDRHFDAFLFAPHPRPVREAIERHRRGLDAGAARYLRDHERELDASVASSAAAYLGVDAGELAFVDSTTMGLALVYRGLLRPGDEVLTTEHDHYATHESLRLAGAKVRRVRLYDDAAQATADGMLERLRGAITPRTRVLALTRVHSVSGVQIPLGRLGDVRPVVVVDGVHALGAVDDPLAGADVFVAGTHKWLGGPRGTGLIWAREAWERMAPVIPSFAPDQNDAGPRFTPGGYHSFEHRWALAQAFEWHAGLDGVTRRIGALATRLKAGLEAIPYVKLVTPPSPDASAGIVCFDVDGIPPEDAVRRLAARRVRASVTPYAERHVRLGCSLHVDERDVAAALNSVKSLRG